MALDRSVLVRTGFAAAVWTLCPWEAKADSTVLVAELSSAEPDRPAGREMSALLLAAARDVEAWDVVPSSSDIEGLFRQGGCRDLEETCLGRLATAAHVDRIVFGALHPIPGDDDRFEVAVRLFDAFTGRVREQWIGTADRGDLEDGDDDVATVAEDLIDALASVPEEGTLVLHADPGSQVLVDGVAAGRVGDDGTFRMRPIHAGRHDVRLVRHGRADYERPVLVEPWVETSLDVGLSSEAETLEASVTPDPDELQLAAPTLAPTALTDAEAALAPRVHEHRPGSDCFLALREPEDSVRTGMPQFDGIQTERRIRISGRVSPSGVRVSAKLDF